VKKVINENNPVKFFNNRYYSNNFIENVDKLSGNKLASINRFSLNDLIGDLRKSIEKKRKSREMFSVTHLPEAWVENKNALQKQQHPLGKCPSGPNLQKNPRKQSPFNLLVH